MTSRSSRFNAERAEEQRVIIQADLDARKTQAARNKLGQFATPPPLARDIAKYLVTLIPAGAKLRFLDPAFGTGSFYSAILAATNGRLQHARGFEIDPHYGQPAQELWRTSSLELSLSDFTRQTPDGSYNLIICNPPYVRHHHLSVKDKVRLNGRTLRAAGVALSGLTGLYCYFMLLSHSWMENDGIAAWLVPSEVLDVNYGREVKRYLAERVELLRIHRFDPNNVQFSDALVSSAVLVFRKRAPSKNHAVSFTYGGSLLKPATERTLRLTEISGQAKWSNLALNGSKKSQNALRLGDLFHVKRGLATGDNGFFILTPEEIQKHDLPWEVFRPILPSARHVQDLEIRADEHGLPILERRLFLLDTMLSESEIRRRYPKLWTYLETGIDDVSKRYLCRTRKPWYAQEVRPAPPILCTYMGRSEKARPFRFILNHSKAAATNVYLLLYPREPLKSLADREPKLIRTVWETLNNVRADELLGEGRVYGGGLHKLEPKELSNLDISRLKPLLSEVAAIGEPLPLFTKD
jgi:adenine-specific DNA-methyltransferase